MLLEYFRQYICGSDQTGILQSPEGALPIHYFQPVGAEPDRDVPSQLRHKQPLLLQIRFKFVPGSVIGVGYAVARLNLFPGDLTLPGHGFSISSLGF